MNEKVATNDILSNLNTAISMLCYAIQQANNKQFRDTLIQTRNKYENLQWELYEIAKQKEFYVPAAPAGIADVEQVKQSLKC